MTGYLRSQVSKTASVSLETLRFYEKSGLLPLPQRTATGYRIYSDDIFNRLEFIKRAKNCGFTLNEIKELLMIIDNSIPDNSYVFSLIDKKINDIDREITELNEMRHILTNVKTNLNSPQCPVLKSLLKE